MQYENADGAGVSEEGNAPALMLLDRLIKFPGSAVERLPVTFPTQQHMFKIAAEQSLILFRMLLSGFLKG